jgi:hypothetical protein
MSESPLGLGAQTLSRQPIAGMRWIQKTLAFLYQYVYASGAQWSLLRLNAASRGAPT